MISASITPLPENGIPGHFSQIYNKDNLIYWLDINGPEETEITIISETIIKHLDRDPDWNLKLLPLPDEYDLTAVVITGTEEQASFHFYGDAQVTLVRNNRATVLTKNVVGKLLTTDQLSFSFIESEKKLDRIIPKPENTYPQTRADFSLKQTGQIFLQSESKTSLINLRAWSTNITEYFSSTRRKSLYIIGIVVLILIFSLFYQLRSKTAENKIKGLAAIEENLNRQMAEAKTLNDVNASLARGQLKQTKENFENEAIKLMGADWRNHSGPENKKLLDLESSLLKIMSDYSRSYSISNLDVHYDLSALKSAVVINSANLHKGVIIALDSQTGTVFKILTNTKSGDIVTGQEKFKNAKMIDFSGDLIAVLKPDSVEAFPKNTSLTRSNSWGNIVSMRAFGGNVYLLDPSKNTIWKHTGTETGFSDAKAYVGEGLSLNLSNAIDLAINGEVFVLSKSGNIVRFSAGNPVDFETKNLEQKFEEPKAIFADDVAENIYILDKNRVVVLTKDGNYVSQYIIPATYTLDPLVMADEETKKIFLVSGPKILSFDLK